MTIQKRNRKIAYSAAVAFVFALLAVALCFGARGVAFADESEVTPTEKLENSLTDGDGGLYDLPDTWVYGTAQNISAPVLTGGNESASTNTHVSLAVEKLVPDESGTGTTTGLVHIASDFSITDIPYYVNEYMPVGEYTLIVDADEIPTDDGDVYESFSQTFEFKVTEAEISDDVKSELAEKLNGNAYTYVYDGNAHFVPEDVDCSAFAGGGVIYDRGEDNFWATSAADEYFDDGFAVTFNLSSMMNNHYHTAEYLVGDEADCAVVAPVHADKYTVYYMLEAKNFKPLVDIESESRKQFLFYVTIVREVAVPVFTSVYNGELQTAAIDDEYMPYSVIENDGGTDAGTYNVTLRLRDPEIYMWEGQTLEERDAEMQTTFEIAKVGNYWTTMPDIVRWTEGEYDPAENVVSGAAMFGTVNIIITDADDNVIFDKLSGVDKLSSARAGVYTLTAYVTGTDNYEGIEGEYVYSKTFKVYGKGGIAWWGILLIVIAVLAVAAIVLFLLDMFDIVHLWGRKKVAAVRAQASVDATIAAVRATQSARELDFEKARAALAQADEPEAVTETTTAIDTETTETVETESDESEPRTENNEPASSQVEALEQRAREAEEKAEQYAAQAQKMKDIADAARQQAAALAAIETPKGKAKTKHKDKGTKE